MRKWIRKRTKIKHKNTGKIEFCPHLGLERKLCHHIGKRRWQIASNNQKRFSFSFHCHFHRRFINNNCVINSCLAPLGWYSMRFAKKTLFLKIISLSQCSVTISGYLENVSENVNNSTAEGWKGLIHHSSYAFMMLNVFFLSYLSLWMNLSLSAITQHIIVTFEIIFLRLCVCLPAENAIKRGSSVQHSSVHVNLMAFRNTFLAVQFMEIDLTMYTFWMLNVGCLNMFYMRLKWIFWGQNSVKKTA